MGKAPVVPEANGQCCLIFRELLKCLSRKNKPMLNAAQKIAPLIELGMEMPLVRSKGIARHARNPIANVTM